MKSDLKDILLIVTVVIILFILPFVLGEQNRATPEPVIEQDEEPAIPQPATTTMLAATTTEIKAEAIPDGVICMADCPLIEVGQVEAEVREYFEDIPVMIAIAECESQFRHWEKDGTVLKNKQGSSAIGVLQIMRSWHEKDALRLGENIKTLEGNMAYGRVLYEAQGTTPWDASKHCWGSANMALNNGISDNS